MVTLSGRVEPMSIEYLEQNPYQVRVIQDEGLKALINSIKTYGFVGHLEARINPNNPEGKRQLVYGHRRLRAATLAGLKTVPVKTVERTNEEMRALSYIENGTVEPLSYWDEGLHFKQLQDGGMSIREIAEAIGKSKGYVQGRLDVLRLPEGPLREAAQNNQIDMSVATVLLTMPAEERDELFERAQSGEITATDLRRIRQYRNNSLVVGDRNDLGGIVYTIPEVKHVEMKPPRLEILPSPSLYSDIEMDEDIPGPSIENTIERVVHMDSTLFHKKTPAEFAANLLIQLRAVVPNLEANAVKADRSSYNEDERAEYDDLVSRLFEFLVMNPR